MALDVYVMEILDAFAAMKAPRDVKDEAALDYINGLVYRSKDTGMHLKYRVYYFKARQHFEEQQEYMKYQRLKSGDGC